MDKDKALALTKQIVPKEATAVDKAEIVTQCVDQLKTATIEIETNWLKLGAIWHFLQINKLWSSYGSHIKNASDFLKEIDLGVTRRSLEYYASIIDSKIGEYIIANNLIIPVTKLRTIAHIVKETGDVEGWVDKAINLPIKALEDEVKEANGKVTSDTCKHEHQEPFTRCKACSKWFKV